MERDGDTAAANLVIDIVNDEPAAVGDVANAVADTSAQPQNIAIVIDRSGSISSSDFQAELNAVRTFIQTLIDEGHPENLAITIVAFDDDATNFGTYINDGSGTELNDSNIIGGRTEDHTSELQTLMRLPYPVIRLKHKPTPAQLIPTQN